MEIQICLKSAQSMQLSFFLEAAINKNVYRSRLVEVDGKTSHESFHVLPNAPQYQVVLQPRGQALSIVVARPPHFVVTVCGVQLVADTLNGVSLEECNFVIEKPPNMFTKVVFTSFSVVKENDLVFFENGPFRIEFCIASKIGDVVIDSIEFDCESLVYFTCKSQIEFSKTDQVIQSFFANRTMKSITGREELYSFAASDKRFMKYSKASQAVDENIECEIRFEKCQLNGDVVSKSHEMLLSEKQLETLDIEAVEVSKRHFRIPNQQFRLISTDCATFLPSDDFYCCMCSDMRDAELQDISRIKQQLEVGCACIELPSGNYAITRYNSHLARGQGCIELKFMPHIRRKEQVNAGCQAEAPHLQAYDFKEVQASQDLASLALEFSQIWTEDCSESCKSDENDMPKAEFDFRASEQLRRTRNRYLKSIYEPVDSGRDSRIEELSQIAHAASEINDNAFVRRSSQIRGSEEFGARERRVSRIPILSKKSKQYLITESRMEQESPFKTLTVDDLEVQDDIQAELENSRARMEQVRRYSQQ